LIAKVDVNLNIIR